MHNKQKEDIKNVQKYILLNLLQLKYTIIVKFISML